MTTQTTPLISVGAAQTDRRMTSKSRDNDLKAQNEFYFFEYCYLRYYTLLKTICKHSFFNVFLFYFYGPVVQFVFIPSVMSLYFNIYFTFKFVLKRFVLKMFYFLGLLLFL